MKPDMRKIGMQISLLMSVTLSFFLSLVGTYLGTLSSGQPFSVPGWIISFLISTVVSLLIGFIVPMKKVQDGMEQKFGLNPRALSTRALESLVSDLIYTPLITLTMVGFAWFQSQGHMPFLPTFLRSLLVTFIVGYLLIFILMPVFIGMVLKANGVQGPPPEARTNG